MDGIARGENGADLRMFVCWGQFLPPFQAIIAQRRRPLPSRKRVCLAPAGTPRWMPLQATKKEMGWWSCRCQIFWLVF